MLTLLAPTKTKLLATLIIVLAMWATQTVSTYVWMSWPFFHGEAFDEFAKKIAEQNPEDLGKAVQQMFPQGSVFVRIMVILPIVEWVARIALSYLAAYIVLRVASFNRSRSSGPVPRAVGTIDRRAFPEVAGNR